MVLQVTNCINKICRRMPGCLRDISKEAERARLPLYYIPQVLDSVSDALSISAQAKLAGFNIKVMQTSNNKRKREDPNNTDHSLGRAMDINGATRDCEPGQASTSFLSTASFSQRQMYLARLDQGSLW